MPRSKTNEEIAADTIRRLAGPTGETGILSAILTTLRYIPDLVAWRNNNGTIKRHRAYIRYGLAPGAADIVGLLGPAGRFIALEVKDAKGVQEEHQKKWAEEVQRRGGFYAVVRSVKEALDAVKRARNPCLFA